MLSYELCKKLKDAGFEQKEDNVFLWVQHYTLSEDDTGWEKQGIDLVYSEECDHEEYGGWHEELCICPTLSELINACGDQFYSVVYASDDDWRCFSERKGGNMDIAYGYSAEEAVANLYLALNPIK